MKLSIVIPFYQSAGSVAALYSKLKDVIAQMGEVDQHQIVMVEDRGRDHSWDLIKGLAALDTNIHAIRLSRNYGQHRAINAGLDLCDGDWIVVMDCDLQDDPYAILSLWAKAKEGYDVVNVRRQNRQDSFIKALRSKVYHSFFNWLSGMSHDHQVANYRIFNRKVLNAVRLMPEQCRILGIQLHWLGFPTATIDFLHAPRHDGKSSYTIKKLLLLALDSAVSFSNKPLYIAVSLGSAISLFSMLVAGWFFARQLIWRIPVTGWASLIISVWFLGGLILANMGVLGVYIGRIYDETKHRPLYAIAERVNC